MLSRGYPGKLVHRKSLSNSISRVSGKRSILLSRDILFVWLFSFLVRIYRIEKGRFVLWDEAHFGKFAMHYLNREFFFDVHPPLGKLLTALSAYIFSAWSGFSFKSEEIYPESVDYVGMRLFHAFFGSLVPVLVYITVRTLKFGRNCARAISFATIIDNALISTSRLILLDPYLLVFVMLSEVFLSRILMDERKLRYISVDLLCLGACIGLATSVKWIGLLTVAHIGVFATYVLLFEIRRRTKEAIYVFFRLSFSLILIPISVYLFCFYVHFLVLIHSGPGDGDMSSRFQSYLRNNEILENSKDLIYGNRVTLRCSSPGVGLLHSHLDRYPTGEQQITMYPHKDSNNHWRIMLVGSNPENVHANEELVLYHIETSTYLSVKDSPAILSNGFLAVSLSLEEMNNTILATTVFLFEATEDIDIVSPVCTKFYVRNKVHNCYLSFSGKKLPDWGHQQGEVICVQDKRQACMWNIEMNKEENKEIEKREPEKVTLTEFFRNVVELNCAMNTVNNALLPDGKDNFGTTPLQWLFPRQWLKFNRWDGSVPRFSMVGNPFVWYISTLNIVSLFFLLCFFSFTRSKTSNRYMSKEMGQLYIILGGWAFHYLPFFLITRILYLHHYLSSLVFAIMGLSFVISRARTLCVLFAVISAGSFLFFSSLTYGHLGEIKSIPGFKLFPKWNLYQE